MTRRLVAVLAPMTAELAPLRRPLALRAREGGLFAGACGGTDVIATVAGVGTAAAARATARALGAGPVAHVFVVGVAGGIGAGSPVGALVVPERVLDVATGAVPRPTPFGDVAPRGLLATADGSWLRRRSPSSPRAARSRSTWRRRRSRRRARRAASRGRSSAASATAPTTGTTDDAIFGLLGADGRPDPGAVARFLLTKPHRIPQLVRLGLGTRRAAGAAAAALTRALRGAVA